MSAAEIIEQIKRLPHEEKQRVRAFLDGPEELHEPRKLSGVELTALMHRLVESDNGSEKEQLREKIVAGFYGPEADA